MNADEVGLAPVLAHPGGTSLPDRAAYVDPDIWTLNAAARPVSGLEEDHEAVGLGRVAGIVAMGLAPVRVVDVEGERILEEVGTRGQADTSQVAAALGVEVPGSHTAERCSPSESRIAVAAAGSIPGAHIQLGCIGLASRASKGSGDMNEAASGHRDKGPSEEVGRGASVHGASSDQDPLGGHAALGLMVRIRQPLALAI